ncbi:MAG TPA: cellulase family glycosylhydrolase [Polyangiaceae bacterium]|nr:cellulase family glycosylhydrolase [Polyangiaceae bacterium]
MKGLALCVAALAVGCARTATPATSAYEAQSPPTPTFELEGKPFCFAGSNNYYAIYKPQPVVEDLFASAQALGLKVLRVWGMLDRGSLDGSVPNADGSGEKDGVYFQYWDAAANRPAYNDGPNGLARLDQVLASAARHDVRLIVVLTNNWRPFGGMDQYLLWYGRHRHHEFYETSEIKQAYRAWLEHVITRKNGLNGRIYRDDPTIFGWELANEPRCNDGSAFDTPDGCGPATLTGWAREMSDYVKSLDGNHLVSVGDEGFLNQQGEHFAYRAEGGVDSAALTALPSVDFGTFHLYPEDWGTPAGFAERWIKDHAALARRLGKPTLLEEYGVKVQRAPDNRGEVSAGFAERRDAYRRYSNWALQSGVGAALPWMLAGVDADGARYPDYDQYAFYRDDATGQLIRGFAQDFARAPACTSARATTQPASPFVRVERRKQPVALGWLAPTL